MHNSSISPLSLHCLRCIPFFTGKSNIAMPCFAFDSYSGAFLLSFLLLNVVVEVVVALMIVVLGDKIQFLMIEIISNVTIVAVLDTLEWPIEIFMVIPRSS